MGNCNQNNQIILLSGKLKQMKLLIERGDYTIYEHISEKKQYEYWVWKSEQENFEEAELTTYDFKQCDSITKIYYQSRGCVVDTFKNEYLFAILMEHPTYNLYDYLDKKKILYKNQIVNMVANIFGAQRTLRSSCQYLGFYNIYTTDGESWKLKPFQKVTSFILNNNQFFGYPAPEEYKQIKYNVEKATVFGFGMLILHLILKKSVEDVYYNSNIAENVLSQKIIELQQNKNYEQDFLKIIIQMLIIDPDQRPNYNQLVDQLTKINIELPSQQLSNLYKIQHINFNNENNSVISDCLVSVPLDKQDYLIKLLNSQQIDEDEKESLESFISQGIQQRNGYSIINYNKFIKLDKAYDYHDFTNVMMYAIKYQGNIKDSKKNGSGTLYLSNNEIFQGNFINDKIEGEGRFQTIDKYIIRGVWKQQKLQQKNQITKVRPIFQEKQILSARRQLNKQYSQNEFNNIPEEFLGQQKEHQIGELTTFTNLQNEFINQINYHSTEDLNDRRQGYILNENGMVIYAGLFRGNQYDGNGVLKNFNSQIINMVNPLDFNQALSLNAWVKYDGEFKDGKKHGNGKLYFSDKSVYSGHFENDQISGQGQFTNLQQQVILGIWRNGLYQNAIL
ncbi:unnamed protein product [Paramecium sonneborni]|uniref:Uncharacterized protein n=1 Tax=Paramecium sonneborni TaxID=65129 RepID=A0A8S1RDJ3_9CILI|nr:unnamed protein product [Paramecium sonneborni]